MTTSAESAIQQTTVGDTSQQGGAKDKGKTKTPKPSEAPGSSALHYEIRSIRKTIEPLPKEDVDILFDFGVPEDENLLIKKENEEDILGGLLNDLEKDTKAPKYWFNKLAEKSKKYEDALWLILNLKATLLSSSNANLLKEWRLNDRVKVPPQDIQEVAAIVSLYEKKIGNEKIIDTNTKIIKDSIFKDGGNAEKRKEIILNIALGNLGGLYKDFAIWGEEDNEKGTESA